MKWYASDGNRVTCFYNSLEMENQNIRGKLNMQKLGLL